MWGDERVNYVLFYYVGCVCFTVSTLLSPAHCFVWLCIAEPYKAVCLQCKA
ncbi:unnamed protein product, partial [Staurois parvus]